MSEMNRKEPPCIFFDTRRFFVFVPPDFGLINKEKKAPRELRADSLVKVFEIHFIHRFNVDIEGRMVIVTPSKI